MRVFWSIFLFLFVTFGVSPLSNAAECNQRKGAKAIDGRNFDAAFDSLRACEDEPDVSATTLRHLAKLYASMDYTTLSEIETEKKVWHLMHRSAALGDQRSLSALIRLYTHGDESLRVKASSDIRLCLESISRMTNVDIGKSATDCFVRR